MVQLFSERKGVMSIYIGTGFIGDDQAANAGRKKIRMPRLRQRILQKHRIFPMHNQDKYWYEIFY